LTTFWEGSNRKKEQRRRLLFLHEPNQKLKAKDDHEHGGSQTEENGNEAPRQQTELLDCKT
jgi:hypothetical protein